MPIKLLLCSPLQQAQCLCDLWLLQVFARGLCDSGYRDEAAAVYCNMLRSGCDKTQQADLLRRCLQVPRTSARPCTCL